MRTLFYSLLLLLSCPGFSQDLLLNGGFEEENICTEYKVNCAPEAWISSSSGFNNYFKDANRAYEGEHCMALEAGHSRKPFERTFLRSQLVCGLKKGHRYRLSFYIKSPHPILDSIGVYFGDMDPLLERKPIHKLAPSFFLGEQQHFINDSSWQPFAIDYRATGAEAFICIANFSRNDMSGPTGISLEDHFFVFLDNISLQPLDPQEELCSNWLEVKADIYDQNERHEFLRRSIQHRRNQGPLKLSLQPTRVITIDTLLLPDLLFATGKKDLQPAAFALLDSFCRSMGGKSIDSVSIEGHTDNTGTDELNQELSEARAGGVAGYLRQCAYFSRARILTRGLGSSQPIAGNDTSAGRQRNRRVEVLVYFH